MKRVLLGFLLSMTTIVAYALVQFVNVKVYETQKVGHGPLIGRILFIDSPKGLLIQPNLANLAPGKHGFHIHEIPSCDDNGLAAGPHYDPKNTKKHLGPNGNGHLGDLPVLVVGENGMDTTAVIAPHLKVADLKGHAIIIHEFGDNYSDTPKPNGGGGARVACGVIQ